jgi:hypothetical protein
MKNHLSKTNSVPDLTVSIDLSVSNMTDLSVSNMTDLSASNITGSSVSNAFTSAFAALRYYRLLSPVLRLNHLLDAALLKAERLKRRAKEAFIAAEDVFSQPDSVDRPVGVELS